MRIRKRVCVVPKPRGGRNPLPIRPKRRHRSPLGVGSELRTTRHGFTLVECLVATVILASAMVVAAKLFTWNALEQREAWRRHVAQQEAANVLERLTATNLEALTADRLADTKLSPTASETLPKATLRVQAHDITAPRPGKRLSVEINWRQSSSVPAAPLRLSGWVFFAEAPP